MNLAGFQRWMEPSARPPAMTPRGNSSKLPTPKVPHDKRLKRSTVTHELSTGRSNSVLAKSSFSNSKFADELKLRSMAPAIVPTAIICAIGANATVADLCIDFNAILFCSSSSSSLYLSISRCPSLFLCLSFTSSFSDLWSRPNRTHVPHAILRLPSSPRQVLQSHSNTGKLQQPKTQNQRQEKQELGSTHSRQQQNVRNGDDHPQEHKTRSQGEMLRTPGCCFLRSPAQHRKEGGPCPGPCRRSFRGASLTPTAGRVQDLVDARGGGGLRWPLGRAVSRT